ncbi:uncharacterized protein LOC143041873 [Mytilus galloprovincialis]|uniref:uncharacterized protein LOC143041873 n=1 Tax=Mytilus galloprovincialis TaxID=29158 RepID=UPI003F7CAAEF
MASSKENFDNSVCPESSNQPMKRCRTESGASSDNNSEQVKYKGNKKKRNSEVESMHSEADSEKTIFSLGTLIKKNISDWTAMDLSPFRMNFEKCANIENVFFNGLSHFAMKKEWSPRILKLGFRSPEDQVKCECFQYAIDNIINIDCNNIEEIEFSDLSKIRHIIEDAHWIADYVGTSDVRDRICRELSSCLKIFIWQLSFMVGRQKNDILEGVSDGMFQELFVNFARIFNMHIVSSLSVPNYPLTVCGRSLVACPDAILCHPTDNGLEKICAVIMVKQCNKEEDLEQARNLRGLQRTSYSRQIGSSYEGQHGGQFLCTLPYSVFGNNGMYGFIVQGTAVTLTSFKPEEGYYDNLCKGCLLNKVATVTHSRTYNILRKDDRKKLVQTFLDIGKLLKFVTVEG